MGQHESKIFVLLAEQAETIQMLNKTVDAVLEKIKPVLTQVPEPTVEGKTNDTNLSQLADILQDKNVAIRSAVRKLEAIVNQCEL